MGNSRHKTGRSVLAQSVDTTAESTPPEIPMTKPFCFEFFKYSLIQLTMCSMIFSVCIICVNLRFKNFIKDNENSVLDELFVVVCIDFMQKRRPMDDRQTRRTGGAVVHRHQPQFF